MKHNKFRTVNADGLTDGDDTAPSPDALDEPSTFTDGDSADLTDPAPRPTHRDGRRSLELVAYGLVPTVALAAAGAAGFLKFQEWSSDQTRLPSSETIAAASDAAVAMLSYKPDTVTADLERASDRLTGEFRGSFTKLVHDVVIPGAQQKKVSATATVPAAASVSSDADSAKVLVFVDQTVIMGNDAPYGTASSVLVDLQRVGDRWLVSGFTPQ